MRKFEEYNPISVAVYFLTVTGIAVFSMNPVMHVLSLIGAVGLFFIRNGGTEAKSHLFYLGLFLVMCIINPIFSHNGATVLFVINNHPITFEALLYGLFASVMILSVLYWCRSFSQIMTSDRLLYCFGKLSSRMAVLFSMSLHFISLFRIQAGKTERAQRAVGLYREDNIVDNTRAKMRIFSILVTWALENGILTADSMSARGYGIGRRTWFKNNRFLRSDILLLVMSLVLFTGALAGVCFGAVEVEFYPRLLFPKPTVLSMLSYCSYAILCLLPIMIELEERMKWNYFVSRI